MHKRPFYVFPVWERGGKRRFFSPTKKAFSPCLRKPWMKPQSIPGRLLLLVLGFHPAPPSHSLKASLETAEHVWGHPGTCLPFRERPLPLPLLPWGETSLYSFPHEPSLSSVFHLLLPGHTGIGQSERGPTEGKPKGRSFSEGYARGVRVFSFVPRLTGQRKEGQASPWGEWTALHCGLMDTAGLGKLVVARYHVESRSPVGLASTCVSLTHSKQTGFLGYLG